MGLYHPLDVLLISSISCCISWHQQKNSKRKALAFNLDRCCHLVICLQLILVHYLDLYTIFWQLSFINVCNKLECLSLEGLASKHSSIFWTFLNYRCKKFNNIGPVFQKHMLITNKLLRCVFSLIIWICI